MLSKITTSVLPKIALLSATCGTSLLARGISSAITFHYELRPPWWTGIIYFEFLEVLPLILMLFLVYQHQTHRNTSIQHSQSATEDTPIHNNY